MEEIHPATKTTEELENESIAKGGTGTQSSKKPSGKTSVLEDILRLILKILVIVLVFMLMFTFLFGATRLKSTAMDPNIKEGDLIIYYRLDKNYVATNCVAFRYNGQTQVMRVVAVAGDTVDMTEDGLVINGALQSEPDPTKDTLPFKEGASFPITLKEGEIFLLGDDRENAEDSRAFGAVKAEDTLGEVM
ncbi:MAG: signal peptidase I, partial [Clostridia bacterium]|nr:signal peptidase I [Clostridia bacterium]